MGKRVRKSTQIRVARKDTAQRKRAALEFQAPRRQGKPGKGLSADSIPPEQWRRLVQLAHPDKHGGSVAAAEATRWLLENRP